MDFRGDREGLVARVRAVLERSCRDSRTVLLGSLAAGSADAYSDIDIEWIVPDDRFTACVARVEEILHGAQPVAEVRGDPDFLHSDRRRLLFVRFEQVPLFWRLDLSVRAQSVADDVDYDEANSAARAREGEWSRPASALANAVAAVKAATRHRPVDARGLLDRGFARIDEADSATGAWTDDIKRLARAAARREPRLAPLAELVAALADEHLAEGLG
ncbi:hypothetical protein ABZ892_33180 [Streptomyces sp. NPDC046924]|uniref:hypothetical protein n=1 Tax=Streptomyces sp. NPDC046924 TaxID=3155136 RepID=UPI0033F59499